MRFQENASLRTTGGRRFLRSVTGDLSEGKTAVVLLPSLLDPVMVRESILHGLARGEYHAMEVRASESSPFSALASAILPLHKKVPSSADIPALLSAKGLPDVVCVSGLEDLPVSSRVEWLAFMARWAGQCQVVADCGGKVVPLLAVMPATGLWKKADPDGVYFSVRLLWGTASALEARMACRIASEAEARTPCARWREHVLPSVAGGDFLAMDALWDCAENGLQDILTALSAYAAKSGWDRDLLVAMGMDGFLSLGNKAVEPPPYFPKDRFYDLWASGAMGWTPEYGLEAHSAALLVFGREDEVRHRVWRGQADLLLPMLDQIRLSLCERFTRLYGEDWPVRWVRPQSDEEDAAARENPLAVQFGHMQYLVGSIPAMLHEQKIGTLIAMSRWVRNELAHYRPVGFRDFEGLVREAARL